MKKKISLLILAGLLVGCGANEKADRKLVCGLTSVNELQQMELNAEVEFNNNSGLLYNGIFSEKYENLEKTETNNQILQGMILRQSILEDLKGVSVDLKATETSFNYQENWNYREIQLEEVLEADDKQKQFVEENYSINKIKEYYEIQGYLCEIKDLD